MLHTVVSGQQVGLLGGPLYILYKIIGVIHLAREHGLVPVYWLEGNDADLNEIRFFYSLSSAGKLVKHVWNPTTCQGQLPGQLLGQPIGNYKVDNALLNLYREYFSIIPVTPHTAQVQQLVFDSYRAGHTLMEVMKSFLSTLFSEAGLDYSSSPKLPNQHQHRLRWFCSDDEEFRKFSQQLLRTEINTTLPGEQSKVFALIGGRREALFNREGEIVTRAKVVVDVKKVTLLPMVWNRSLLQDAFLKARYYVAGPGEVKYLNALQPRYVSYGITPAHVVPRMSATLVDEEVLMAIERLGINLDIIISSNYSVWQEHLERSYFQSDLSIRAERQHKMTEKNQYIKTLKTTTTKSNQEIKQLEKNTYLQIKHELGKKRVQFRGDTAAMQQTLATVGQFLHPYPHINQHFSQERFHNIVTLLNRYGIGFIKELYTQHQFTKKIIQLNKK